MSDYNEESGAGIKVIRAAFSAALSQREKIDIAKKDIVQSVGFSEQKFLSFLDFNPMGYPMGDELIAIAQMYSESSDSSEITNDDFKISTLDIELDDAKAHLHDKLLNISPDIEPFVSLYNDYPVLNQVYEKFLRYSEFAGKVSANSKEFKQAEDFLFPKNENGMPEESDAYKLYIDYLDKCYELELDIANASKSGSTLKVNRLKNKLTQAQAEWNTLGEKRKVEEALEILTLSHAKVSYDDERNTFIELLESRLRTRLGSSKNYATVTILPLKPLLDSKEGAQWQRFSLTKEDIERYVTPDICQIFNISEEELSYVLKNFKSASMQYIRVFLTREWLSKEFLTARYWKNPSSILSDGNGSGALPTFISSAFFIKSAKFEMHRGINVYEAGDNNYQNKKVKEVFAYEVIETPLIEILTDDHREKSSDVKLITKRDINNLTVINSLRSQERLRHKEAEKIELPRELLSHRFRPGTIIKTRPSRRRKEVEKIELPRELLQAEFKPYIMNDGRNRLAARDARDAEARINARYMARGGAVMEAARTPVREAPMIPASSSLAVARATEVVEAKSTVRSRAAVRAAARAPATAYLAAALATARAARAAAKVSFEQIKKLNISGKIKHKNILDEKDLNINLVFLDKNNNELGIEDIQLSRQRDNIVFSVNGNKIQDVNRFEKSVVQSIIIELIDKKGNNLIEKRIELIDESKDIILDWNVSFDTVVMELSSSITSTLFAYTLQLMPKSPNPDESLFSS